MAKAGKILVKRRSVNYNAQAKQSPTGNKKISVGKSKGVGMQHNQSANSGCSGGCG